MTVASTLEPLGLEKRDLADRFFTADEASRLCTLFFGRGPKTPFPPPALIRRVSAARWECEFQSFDGSFDVEWSTAFWNPESDAFGPEPADRGLQHFASSFWENDAHPRSAGGSGVQLVRLFDPERLVVFSIGTHRATVLGSGDVWPIVESILTAREAGGPSAPCSPSTPDGATSTPPS